MSLSRDGNKVEYLLLPENRHRLVGSDGSYWRRVNRKPTADGYIPINLNRKGRRFLHEIVLEMFVGPRPEGMEGCHNDGNPANNAVENLRWDTHQANMDDRGRHGRNQDGSKNVNAKLTEADIPTIRMLRKSGVSNADIGRRFGVTEYPIWAIVTGRAWRHVPDPDGSPGKALNDPGSTDQLPPLGGSEETDRGTRNPPWYQANGCDRDGNQAAPPEGDSRPPDTPKKEEQETP